MATQTHDAPTPGVRPPRTWGSVLRYIGIAVALIYALFPVVFIISAAFNPGGTLTTTSLIPKGASLINFTDLFGLRPYWSWYKNSLIICSVATVASVFIGALAAFAFGRRIPERSAVRRSIPVRPGRFRGRSRGEFSWSRP